MLNPAYPTLRSAASQDSPHPPVRPPLPREHGAWGLLFQPLLAAALLASAFSWLFLAALGLASCGSLLREPLTVFIRHRFLWKRDTIESRMALRWLLVTGGGATLCAAMLATAYPAPILLGILAGGALLTAFAVAMTLRNRQRSLALQTVSAIALSGTGWLVFLLFPQTSTHLAWVLWALLALHAVATIPIVHCRLERKAHKPRSAALENGSWLLVALSSLACLVVPQLWPPLLFSAVANSWELLRLRDQGQLSQPVARVGLRLLAASLIHTVLTVVALQTYL